MPGHETRDAYNEDQREVASDQGRVSPFSRRIADRGVHDKAIQSQPSAMDVFLQVALKRVNNSVCQFPGEVAAERH